MDAIAKTRLIRFVVYPACFLLAFTVMLYLTLPYPMIAEQLAAAGRRAGLDVTVGSIGPGLSGIRAKAVRITPARKDGQSAEPQPLMVDQIELRPTLFPPGAAFHAHLFDGTADGRVGLGKKPRVELRLKALDLGKSNAKAVFGLDVAGKLNGALNLESSEPVNLGPRGLEYDASKLSGNLGVGADGLAINGGTVANYDLPKAELGRLDAVVKFEPGKASITTFKTTGNDAEASLEGDVTLQRLLAVSPLKLKLKFKPSDDFLKRNSFIQTGLNFAMSRDPKGFYGASIDRTVGNPRFVASR